MKKDIEWLKEKVDDLQIYSNPDVPKDRNDLYTQYVEGVNDAVRQVKVLVGELDEPEVLSWEWIDEYSYIIEEYWGVADMMSEPQYVVSVENLQNLLVPKQEKVEVPRFVADILKSKTFDSLSTAFIELFSANAGHYYGEDVCKWIVSNEEAFARAWLDGYEVEKEQKYYVLDTEDIPMLVKSYGDVNRANTHLSIHEKGRNTEHYQLTEQEIKGYDPRYMTFAKPVEESGE